MDNITVKVKKHNQNVQMPYQADKGSVGHDLRAFFEDEYGEKVEKIILQPNAEYKINTQTSFEIPEGYFMMICPRSSAGIKKNLVLKNTLGVIDSSYRGIVYLFVKNIGDEPIEIEDGERITQAIVLPYPQVQYVEVDELSETERGAGGIGSTGKN